MGILTQAWEKTHPLGSYGQPKQSSSQQQYAQPQQQYAQPQQGQQQSSPYSAPDMSMYSQQQQSPYNAYNVPRTPPQGARVNDLSGSVPSNQLFGQAYNQAAKQYGAGNQATSFTLPGTYMSQGYDPITGAYGQPTGGQSWDGNMAYNAINNRPGPITATSTFAGGQPMDWQAGMTQRMAFAGQLSDRLNQYTGGQASGPVTFNQGQLIQQANDQIANGTFANPFMPQQPYAQPYAQPYSQPYSQPTYSQPVQQAMDDATQYMLGTKWNNPFGSTSQANNQMPSWSQQTYDPTPQQSAQVPSGFEQFLTQRGLMNDWNAFNTRSQPATQPASNPAGPSFGNDAIQPTNAPQRSPYEQDGGMSFGNDVWMPPQQVQPAPAKRATGGGISFAARPIQPRPQGDEYNPSDSQDSLPPVPDEKEPPKKPVNQARGGVIGRLKSIRRK